MGEPEGRDIGEPARTTGEPAPITQQLRLPLVGHPKPVLPFRILYPTLS